MSKDVSITQTVQINKEQLINLSLTAYEFDAIWGAVRYCFEREVYNNTNSKLPLLGILQKNDIQSDDKDIADELKNMGWNCVCIDSND